MGKGVHSNGNKSLIIAVSAICAFLLAAAVLIFVLAKNNKEKNTADAFKTVVSSDGSSSAEYVDSELSSQTDLQSGQASNPVVTDNPEEAKPTLIISKPTSKDISVSDENYTFMGMSDPAYPLIVNGDEIKREVSGAFSYEVKLKPGANYFKFKNHNDDLTYTVRYKYAIINSYSPMASQMYASGSSFTVSVNARANSIVTASFNGKTVTLSKTTVQSDDVTVKNDTFVDYSGSFSLPGNNASDLSLGKISFKAVNSGLTETKTSGTITVKKANISQIAEVVAYEAETFDGSTSDDMSRPTNNYLPKGTVDFVVGKAYNSGKEYLKLRCGRRVYVSKKNGTSTSQVTKQYAGTLPGTNKLNLASLSVSERFTVITLDSDWKAPFFLDYLPQSYKNPSTQDYRISSFTAKYIEIKFCYAKQLTGKINLGKYNPLFSSYEVKKSGSDYILRLNLRNTGTFYGWNAAYNSKGQLVFTFLHPAQVTAAANKYGVHLSGVKVMLDVGHGGADSGAVGIGNLYEKNRNMYLAKLIKNELESVGATVILNRDGDSTLNPDQRCMKLIDTKPDICIAIHHDASESSVPNGFGCFYSSPFSASPAGMVYKETIAKSIYNASAAKNCNRLQWHYYYVARTAVCPVVLTENGFITGSADYAGITSTSVNQKKAEAITAGIAKYFLSIRHGIPLNKILGKDTSPATSSASSTSSVTSSAVTSSAVTSSSTTSTESSSSSQESASSETTSSHESDSSSDTSHEQPVGNDGE